MTYYYKYTKHLNVDLFIGDRLKFPDSFVIMSMTELISSKKCDLFFLSDYETKKWSTNIIDSHMFKCWFYSQDNQYLLEKRLALFLDNVLMFIKHTFPNQQLVIRLLSPSRNIYNLHNKDNSYKIILEYYHNCSCHSGLMVSSRDLYRQIQFNDGMEVATLLFPYNIVSKQVGINLELEMEDVF